VRVYHTLGDRDSLVAFSLSQQGINPDTLPGGLPALSPVEIQMRDLAAQVEQAKKDAQTAHAAQVAAEGEYTRGKLPWFVYRKPESAFGSAPYVKGQWFTAEPWFNIGGNSEFTYAAAKFFNDSPEWRDYLSRLKLDPGAEYLTALMQDNREGKSGKEYVTALYIRQGEFWKPLGFYETFVSSGWVRFRDNALIPITITIAAADDGVSGHFNLTATAGTYSERYPNLSVLSGAGGVVLGDQTNSLLLAALAEGGGSLTSSTRPVNGSYVLGASGTNVASATAGADGTPGTTHYTGTAGSGDAGIAKFEGDPDVTIVAVDDCGNSNRVAINTALVAHAVAEQRIAVINGNSGVSISSAITYVGTNASAYRSERAIFAWPWVYVKDEGGTERLVPPSVMLAGALSRMPRHLGTHWKDPRNTVAYSGISRLEYAVSRANLILAQNAGIQCIVPAGDYYAPKSGVTTSLTVNQTQVSRRRIADFLMRAVSDGQEAYEGGPIDPATRSRQLAGVKRTLQAFVDAGRRTARPGRGHEAGQRE
jgi:hypothetical protein